MTKLLKLLFCLLTSSVLASSTRMIGYYSLADGYAGQTGCAPILTPDLIPADLYTHIIFAFVSIDANQNPVPPTNATIDLFNQVQSMKLRNPNLKTMVSFGGWAMNMSLYSNGLSTENGRSNLARNVMAYARQWNWDGVDFDWEYPADPERGGNPQDPQNFVAFISEMRQAIEAESIPAGKSKLIISIPLPGGAYYGQYYDMNSMIQNLDFANIMAYNLHGPWEPVIYCSANYYDGTASDSPLHGYSIQDAVTYFLTQNGSTLPADKFNLGVTFAGVAFSLTDPSENTPGSPDIGQGNGGPCTREAGYMAYFEVETLISSGSVVPTLDPVGVCKYFTYNTNQWIGYDDADTLAQKVSLVKSVGLGGVSVWAMYAESATGPVLQTAIANALFSSGKPSASDSTPIASPSTSSSVSVSTPSTSTTNSAGSTSISTGSTSISAGSTSSNSVSASTSTASSSSSSSTNSNLPKITTGLLAAPINFEANDSSKLLLSLIVLALTLLLTL